MSVMSRQFEGCCTATILVDFGESHTSEYGYKKVTYNEIWEGVVGQIERSRSMGIITAILTNQQETGHKVLKGLGFSCSEESSKRNHSNTKITLYYLTNIKDYVVPEAPQELVKAKSKPLRGPDGRFVKKEVVGYHLYYMLGVSNITPQRTCGA